MKLESRNLQRIVNAPRWSFAPITLWNLKLVGSNFEFGAVAKLSLAARARVAAKNSSFDERFQQLEQVMESWVIRGGGGIK